MHFYLLLLYKTRNELEDAGFPPMMEEYYDSSAPSSTFVRIGSIDLSGNVTSEVRSRPLDRVIANLTFGMDAFEGLNEEIRNISEANLGRRGCTTDEVYDILRSYFAEKLRKFLVDTARDVSAGSLSNEGSNTVKEAKKLFASASNAFKSYADDAGRKTGDSLQESLASRLERIGVPSSREKLSALRDLSSSAAQSVDVKSVAGAQLKRLREAYQKSRDSDRAVDNAALVYKTRSTDDEECSDDGDSDGDSNDETTQSEQAKETVIVFPDW